MRVSDNRRVVFRCEAVDVDLIRYHRDEGALMMNGIADDRVGPMRNQSNLGELIRKSLDDMGWGTVPLAAAHPSVPLPAIGKPSGPRRKPTGGT